MQNLRKPKFDENDEIKMPEIPDGVFWCPLIGDWVDDCPEECSGCDPMGVL